MTSKMIALRILDGVFIGFTMLLMMGVAGLPLQWLLDLVEMSLREFQGFALFVVFAALLLIHAIATSNSAPRPPAALDHDVKPPELMFERRPDTVVFARRE